MVLDIHWDGASGERRSSITIAADARETLTIGRGPVRIAVPGGRIFSLPALPEHKILVVGTGSERRLTNLESRVAIALGRALALKGFSLVTGAWPGVDLAVGQAFADEVTRTGSDHTNRISHIVAADRNPVLWPGHDGKIHAVSPRALRQNFMDAATAVIIIGGRNYTEAIGEMAIGQKKPCLPIAKTKGSAESIFLKLLDASLPVRRLDRGAFSLLDGDAKTDAEAEALADDVILLLGAMLEKQERTAYQTLANGVLSRIAQKSFPYLNAYAYELLGATRSEGAFDEFPETDGPDGGDPGPLLKAKELPAEALSEAIRQFPAEACRWLVYDVERIVVDGDLQASALLLARDILVDLATTLERGQAWKVLDQALAVRQPITVARLHDVIRRSSNLAEDGHDELWLMNAHLSEILKNKGWGEGSNLWREPPRRMPRISKEREKKIRPRAVSGGANVFISHNGADAAQAERLAQEIKTAGHNVWLDSWEILAGDSINDGIDQGLSKADYVVLCLSSSDVSPWTEVERMLALLRQMGGKGGKLLAARLSGGDRPAIPANIKYTDLVKDWAGGVANLLRAIRRPVKAIDVYIAHAPGEEEIAEKLAKPLEAAGYTVHHRGTVLVGESIDIEEEVGQFFNRGCPVVLCGTLKAVGSRWARQIIQAARAGSHLTKIFPVLMDVDADIEHLVGVGIKYADCVLNFDHGIADLLTSLKAKFPLDDTPPPPEATTITRWLEALVKRVGYIEISGIGSGVGRTRDASRYPIEQLYTTLRSRGEAMARGDGGQTVADLLPRHDRLLIEGQPGAGKTTFLHLVTAMLGRDILGIPNPAGEPWRSTHLALNASAPLRVPLFLKLSELAVTLEKDPLTNGDGRHRLLDLLDKYASAEPGPAWRTHWEGLLTRGEAILLLDGLDEVADETLRRRVFTIFRDACEHWKKSPIIVTSRPIAVEAVKTMGFHHAVIEPFGEREIKEFVERWVAALHTLPIGQRPEGKAGDKADRITTTVLARPAIRRLAANPVMLTCLCVVHWNEGDLPDGRSRFYRAVIRWLIAARTTQRKMAGFSDTFALEVLAGLAYEMMVGSLGSQNAKLTWLDFERAATTVANFGRERHFPQIASLPAARRWLRFECLWGDIVMEQTGEGISFRHLAFQEYLAAQYLAWLGDGDAAADWWPMLKNRLDDMQWRETVDLFPGALFDEGGRRRVDLLLERVAGLLGQSRKLADEARTFGILGRILSFSYVFNYRPQPVIEGLLEQLRQRIFLAFTPEGAAEVPVRMRIEVAEVLGQGGDPRLSDDTVIKVPGTDISLGKYPVTVQEFQGFIDAGGYDEQAFWGEDGWRLRRQHWRAAPFNWELQIEHPNWPVTNVSWFEAEAWCRWRSAVTGQNWRLPAEAEWKGASGKDERRYPWGEAPPNSEQANYGRNVGNPTPVGVYPAGNGPFGHCDLAGNVWEWCLEWYQRTVYDDSGEGSLTYQEGTICGGAWDSDAIEVGAAKSYIETKNSYNNLGFRSALVHRRLDSRGTPDSFEELPQPSEADPWKGIESKYPIQSRLKGRVTKITDYGVFVELEPGIEGLVRVSEISWVKNSLHPSKLFSTSQEVEVMVLNVNPNKRRINLGIKQFQPDPFEAVAASLKKGDVVTCTVTQVADNGIEVLVGDGYNGFIRKADLSCDRSEQRPERFATCEKVDAKVTQVEFSRRRISLSIKAREKEEKKQAMAKYGSSDSGGSLDDILGGALKSPIEDGLMIMLRVQTQPST